MNDKQADVKIPNDTKNEGEEVKKIGLKKTVGLASGVSIIVGTMIGSGIFISPKGVLYATNSIGLCLIIWVLCGVVSILGALCYAELGALITESGGELIYIYRSYQTLNKVVANLLGFVCSWSTALILRPTAFAAISLASAKYIFTPIIGACGPPPTLVKFGASAIMIFICFINSYSVKITQKIIVSLTFSKVLALAIVSIGGIIRLIQGYTENFENAFAGSTTNVLTIAGGFYGGLWAYDGWGNLNYVTEEIINPKRNLPLSIFISVPLVMCLYLLVNISYFTVMTKDGLLASGAVAVTWGNAVLGKYFQWLLPTAVALSTFSTATASLYSGTRMAYVAAREGLQVKLLSYVNVHRNTPQPSLIFTCFLGLLYLIPNNLDDLIDIFSFVTWMFYGLATSGLIIMRFTSKTRERPFKVPLPIAFIVLIISIYLVFAPIIDNPRIEYLVALGVILAGFIFYIPLIHFKWDVPYFCYVTRFFQNLLEVSPPDKTE